MPYRMPWSTVINTLLKKSGHASSSVTVNENGENLEISSPNQDALHTLSTLLNSPKSLQHALTETLHFLDPTLHQSPEDLADKATEWPACFDRPGFITGEHILDSLGRVLSPYQVGQFWKLEPTLVQRQGLAVEKKDIVEKGIFQITFAKPPSLKGQVGGSRERAQYEALINIYEAQLKTYLTTLQYFTKAELLGCFTKTQSDTPAEDIDVPAAAAESHAYLSTDILQSLLYIAKREGSFHICFHYLDFLRYLFPGVAISPITEKNTAGVNTFSLVINKHELVVFLCACFRNGFIVNVDASKQTATPLCFAPLSSEKKDMHLDLLLDCSGSMASCFDSFQVQILAFLSQIRAVSPNTVVSLHPFASARHPLSQPETFAIHEQEKIEAYVRSLSADGLTPLWDVLLEQYSNSENIERKFCEPVVLLFTDGQHTQLLVADQNISADAKYKKVLDFIVHLQGERQPPKFYTIGLGAEHDRETLQTFARQTGASYLSLDRIEEFAKIYEELAQMVTARAIMRVGYAGGSIEPISVMVDTVVPGPDLPLHQPIVINGVTYTRNIHSRAPRARQSAIGPFWQHEQAESVVPPPTMTAAAAAAAAAEPTPTASQSESSRLPSLASS